MDEAMTQAINILKQGMEPAPTAAPTPTSPAPTAEPAAQQAAPVTETPAPAAEPKKDENGEFASRFAALSKREKELARREAELKSQPKMKTVEELREIAKQDPLKMLEEVGMTFEQISQHILDSGINTPEGKISKVEERIKALETKEKELAEKEARMREETAVKEFRTEIKTFLSKDPEKYELTQGSQSEGLVYEVIDLHYQKTGEVMAIEEACGHVEAYLEEQVDKWAPYKKVQKRFAPKPQEPKADPQPKAEVKTETKNQTLTNDDASASREVRVAPRTREDEILEAVKLLRFNAS